MIMFIMLARPFQEPRLNQLEIFNELCIIGAAYHLIAFTEYLSDPEMQYMVGWFIIGITTFNIAVNMIIMTGLSLR
jgi:hypothetical protein